MSNPPIIGLHVLPATPAEEWANTTSSSLGERATTSSESSTPGPQLPGAFPRESEGDDRTSDTANWHIPTRDDVKGTVKNAVESAKQYLPDAVASYFPPVASEKHPAATQPSVERDVSLPQGNGSDTPSHTDSGESATIFDERHHHDQIPEIPPCNDPNPAATEIDTSKLTPHTNPNRPESSVSSSDTNFSTQAQAGSPMSTPDTPVGNANPTTVEQPATATVNDANQAAVSSATAVTASASHTPRVQTREEVSQREDGVATHGEFKGAQPPVVNTSPRTHPLAGVGAKWKGVPLDEPYQRALDADSELQLNIGIVEDKTSAIKAEKQDEASADPRPGPPDTNLDLTRANTGHSPIGHVAHKRDESTASEASSGGSKTKNTNSRKGGGTVEGSSPRASFMDKVRGEVKVISGKIAHKEEKVEEGKRLMGKHA
ncbi:hypothetical protein LshimejAT787_2600480 [Lyophyllum shimeji]|uniref:Uncharacterized protein n=1 Tax=Lyophyllum shimeji TaxID=47721 RepID=A0A9P3UVB5_LYOSH|nr:hypothetical protein LshimejAT787_2600480 [Lyophyllum shimeji]